MSAEGKVILVTGSTDGIGMETALQLARQGARVIVHGRNRVRGEAVRDQIRRESKNDSVDLLIADLASQSQIHELADAIKRQYDRLDVLVNNAGVYLKERRLTQDKLEMTLAVNHLAPFLLTHLLLDLLESSAPSRIVTVSSRTHESIRHVDLNNLQGQTRYDGYEAYALSKLGNILFTYELARRVEKSRVMANTLHPGAVNTKLLRRGFGNYGLEPVQGAETPVFLASSPDVEGITGRYYVNKQPAVSSPLSHKRELQDQFWRVSAELTGIHETERQH